MNVVWPKPLRRFFRRRWSRTATFVVIALICVGVAVGGARWWNDTHPIGVDGAVAALPASTQSFRFTDWSEVRIQLRVMQGQEVNKLGTWLDPSTYAAGSDAADVLSTASFTSAIYDQANLDNDVMVQRRLGFSPANLQWEAYGSLAGGAVDIVKPNATVDLRTVGENIKKAGYRATAGNPNIWAAPESLQADLPDFSNIAVFPDQHLILASANTTMLTAAMNTVLGKAPALKTVTSLKDMVGTLGQPVAADVWVRDSVCGDSAISYSAQGAPDADTEQQINDAIGRVGGVAPLEGFALTLNDDGTLTAAMQYGTDVAAQHDLKARATLATGQRYSIGADFPDYFSLVSSKTSDSTILLGLRPVEGSDAATGGVPTLPWLAQGDVIFASC